MNALPFGYRPLGWNAGLTAQDYLAHMKAEFDRLSINLPDDLRQFREVWHGLSEREEKRPWIQPDYETLKRFGIRGDYAEIYGGRRPLNEFIHLKSMNYVAYPIAGKHLWGKSRKPTSDECFVSDIICCLRKQVEEFSREASRSYKVEVHSKFKFKLEDRVLSRSATEVESLVVDWEIEQL